MKQYLAFFVLVFLILYSIRLGLRNEKRISFVESILVEYKQEYDQYQKEQIIKSKINLLISPYGKKNYQNKYYIAKRFYEELGETYARTALCVVKNESGFRTDAYNPRNTDGSNDAGCWQINSIHKLSDKIRFNCVKSTDWALKKIKYEKNFSAWTAYFKYCL